MQESALEQAVIVATRRYAKRQETWFRHQLAGAPVLTLDAVDEAETLARSIVEHWEAEGN
jgi:tRNA A37 N6-isopentenylltransferase MiaA